jgi:hypothetical protein
MTIQEKLQALAARENSTNSKVQTIKDENIPGDAVIWGKEDLMNRSTSVEILGVDKLARKDGSGFIYRLTLAGGKQVISNEPCETGVVRIVTIPAGVFTMKFDSATGKFSSSEANVCDTERVRVLGAGVLTYGMKLKAQLAAGLVKMASVD